MVEVKNSVLREGGKYYVRKGGREYKYCFGSKCRPLVKWRYNKLFV
jgi:hypothetical protein